ncbi:hypothetical protein [Escherichia coli]|uniref:hypothetical protein n=1 Tax=Escherichia coli TaxID=562 RepID=UPI003B28B3FC
MARAAINANSYLQLDVIGIADSGAGKAATGAVTVSGTAISSGTLSVWVAGEQVTVDVETGDEPSKIIPALVEAMTQTPSLLVTGEYKSETSQLTVTTRTKGAWGMTLPCRVHHGRRSDRERHADGERRNGPGYSARTGCSFRRRSQHSDLSVQYHASPCRPEAASGENRERDGTARRDWLCGLDGQSRNGITLAV